VGMEGERSHYRATESRKSKVSRGPQIKGR
jgi:hypothetical protein